MRFPADRMTVFLGLLSEFFSSSPQNRKVSFPSAKTWFDKVRSLLVSKLQSPVQNQIMGCFSSMYLNVVIFTLIGGFHAEVGEVEFDPVAL